jgi:hypothetical protein
LAAFAELDPDELDEAAPALELELDELPQAATVSAAPTAPAVNSTRLPRHARETPPDTFKSSSSLFRSARSGPFSVVIGTIVPRQLAHRAKVFDLADISC